MPARLIRALITDLDGTAVAIASSGGDISDATKQAVQQALRAGHKLTCASGRQWELVEPVITQLGFVSPCIVDGGTRVVDPLTGRTLWEKPLSAGTPARVLKIFKAHTSTGMVMHSADLVQHPLAEVIAVPRRTRFLYLLAVPESAAVAIVDDLNPQGFAVAHITPSWSGGGLIDIHVTHPEATKEHAIAWWQRHMGVTRAETLGLGDSGNDVPIFEASGFKVAVGNATPALKALADYIAPPVEEHALLHVIDKFLLDKN